MTKGGPMIRYTSSSTAGSTREPRPDALREAMRQRGPGLVSKMGEVHRN
jgi:hypothetical protein